MNVDERTVQWRGRGTGTNGSVPGSNFWVCESRSQRRKKKNDLEDGHNGLINGEDKEGVKTGRAAVDCSVSWPCSLEFWA